MQIWPDMHVLRQEVEIGKTTLFCQLDEQRVQMLIDKSKGTRGQTKIHYTSLALPVSAEFLAQLCVGFMCLEYVIE